MIEQDRLPNSHPLVDGILPKTTKFYPNQKNKVATPLATLNHVPNSEDDYLNHNNKADIEICQCHIFFKQVNRVICIIY